MPYALKRLSLLTTAALVGGMILMPVLGIHAQETEDETPTLSVRFSGQLIELASTDIPTTIVVREDPTGEWTDYEVDVTEDTDFGTNDLNTTGMSDWITGDWLMVEGILNETTGMVTASVIVNHSAAPDKFDGLNGWITKIDETASTMTIQWNNVEHTVSVTDRTHMVVPPINPASLSDFELSDRVRIRLYEDSDIENEASVILALRRGDEIFLKARTRGFSAELDGIVKIDDESGYLEVTLLANEHLRVDDVNNLVGNEGDELVIGFDGDTTFVRRFHGETDVDEFQVGDQLFIVGRVNDDGSITARVVQDRDIWKTSVLNHRAKVTSVDTQENEITAQLPTGMTVEIYYTDSTEFKMHSGDDATESDLEVGEWVNARGIAHKEDEGVDIDAEQITIFDLANFKERLAELEERFGDPGEDEGEEAEEAEEAEEEDETDLESPDETVTEPDETDEPEEAEEAEEVEEEDESDSETTDETEAEAESEEGEEGDESDSETTDETETEDVEEEEIETS